jgi:hypothetical protein
VNHELRFPGITDTRTGYNIGAQTSKKGGNGAPGFIRLREYF